MLHIKSGSKSNTNSRDNHTLQKYDVFMVFKSETALTIIFISYFFLFHPQVLQWDFWNPDYFLLLSLTIISAFYCNDSNEEDLHHRFTSFIAQIPYLFMFGKKNTKIGVKSLILDLQQKSNLFWNIWDETFPMSYCEQ